MFNPYETLGLSSTATKDEAKAAYRKLAQRHHPDKGGDEDEFKKVKGAWESIDNGWIAESVTASYTTSKSSFTTRPSYGQSKPQSTWQGADTDPYSPYYNPRAAAAKARYQYPPGYRPQPSGPNVVTAYNPEPERRSNVGDFIARVSMAEAYRGFICEVEVEGKKYRVKIPEGIPNGLRFTVPIEEDGKEDVTVTTRFTQSAFGFKGIDTALRENVIVNSGPGSVYRTKDLTITLPYYIGPRGRTNGTVEFEDFLGERITLKVPADHDLRRPLKVEGKGYVDWYTSHSQSGQQRGDIHVTLMPTDIPPPTSLGTGVRYY